MSSRWLQAFKEIHDRSPSKEDFMLAPIHIREEFLGPSGPEKKEKIDAKPVKKTGVRLKRPADDQFSPFKPLPKRQAQDSATTPTRSLKKSRSLFASETKTRSSDFPSEKKRSNSLFLDDAVSEGLKTPTRSPQKALRTPLQTRTRSGFFTPEKMEPSCVRTRSSFFTPEKSNSIFVDDAIPEVLKTPIRSPQKMLRTALQIRNVDALLAPSPEKKPPVIEEHPCFEAEDVPEENRAKKTTKRVVGGSAKVFDPTTGRIIARPFKTQAADAAPEKKTRKPKEKGNFVRINMKKKSFTRGKVSAEAKRKLKRKQMWKKRFNK